MKSINKSVICGNITKDAEIRETQGGTKVATFSVATNREWKDAKGEKQTQTEFHNIVAWSWLAEIVEKFTKKGDKIYVEGRITYRQWEDKDGNTKSKTEIVAEDLMLMSNGEKGEKKITKKEAEDAFELPDIDFP